MIRQTLFSESLNENPKTSFSEIDEIFISFPEQNDSIQVKPSLINRDQNKQFLYFKPLDFN